LMGVERRIRGLVAVKYLERYDQTSVMQSVQHAASIAQVMNLPSPVRSPPVNMIDAIAITMAEPTPVDLSKDKFAAEVGDVHPLSPLELGAVMLAGASAQGIVVAEWSTVNVPLTDVVIEVETTASSVI